MQTEAPPKPSGAENIWQHKSDDEVAWSVVGRRRARSMRGTRAVTRARVLIDAISSNEIVSAIVNTPVAQKKYTWRRPDRK